MSQWTHILTAAELDARYAATAALDSRFAAQQRACYEAMTPIQLRASIAGAWYANDPDGYQMARSHLALRYDEEPMHHAVANPLRSREEAKRHLDPFLDQPGRELLAKMNEKAESDPAYAERLTNWLNNGSTLELRSLVEPFGRYIGDLAFLNAVNGLDSNRGRGAAING